MSIAEQTPDARVAAQLGMMEEHVARAREDWNNDPRGTVVRAILTDRLNQEHAQRMRKLRTVKADELQKTQGELDALDLAISIVSKPTPNL